MEAFDFSPETVDALRALERVMPLNDDLDAVLTDLCSVSVKVIRGCDSASVTVTEGDKVRTPAATDEVAVQLDLAQYEAGAGPCLEAVARTETIVVADLKTDGRWPEFSRSALENGFSSCLSVPMKEIASLTGGFNLYSRARGAFNGTPPLLIDLLATRASVAIENAQIYGASKRLIDQLNAAIKTREVIGAAKGILMARESVTEREAFEMLVRLSQNSNVKLREVAQKILDQEQNH